MRRLLVFILLLIGIGLCGCKEEQLKVTEEKRDAKHLLGDWAAITDGKLE